MKNYLLIFTLACFVPAQAALITNGSFETPVVPVGSFLNFASGSTLITGWTVVGPQASIVSGTFSQECCTFPAEDGSQWLDLTGFNANSTEGVEQTVATTPGTNYTLSFWIGNVFDPGGIFGTTSTVDVRLGGVGGTLLGAFTNHSTTTGTQVWQQFTTSFTAAGSSTTLAFLNADPGNDNANGLDNIVLTANETGIPEPGTLSLLGIAIIGLGLVRRPRQHSGSKPHHLG
jgi:Protein of unknown function (DUF642)/PEP-CTERM motif